MAAPLHFPTRAGARDTLLVVSFSTPRQPSGVSQPAVQLPSRLRGGDGGGARRRHATGSPRVRWCLTRWMWPTSASSSASTAGSYFMDHPGMLNGTGVQTYAPAGAEARALSILHATTFGAHRDRVRAGRPHRAQPRRPRTGAPLSENGTVEKAMTNVTKLDRQLTGPCPPRLGAEVGHHRHTDAPPAWARTRCGPWSPRLRRWPHRALLPHGRELSGGRSRGRGAARCRGNHYRGGRSLVKLASTFQVSDELAEDAGYLIVAIQREVLLGTLVKEGNRLWPRCWLPSWVSSVRGCTGCRWCPAPSSQPALRGCSARGAGCSTPRVACGWTPVTTPNGRRDARGHVLGGPLCQREFSDETRPHNSRQHTLLHPIGNPVLGPIVDYLSGWWGVRQSRAPGHLTASTSLGAVGASWR